MPNIIQGVKVDGVIYKYDYESLENLPDPLPDVNASRDIDKVLKVGSQGDLEWGSELPTSQVSDAGKVLTVDGYGAPSWEQQLPSHAVSDAGKILTVSNANDLSWETKGEYVPTHNSSDAGKILTISNTNNLSWRTPGEYVPAYNTSDGGKILKVENSGQSLIWGSLSDPLPVTSSAVIGKSLMYSRNGVEWNSPLPDYNESHANEYLHIDSAGDLVWGLLPANGLPSAVGSSVGSLLMVGSSEGDLAWRQLIPQHDTEGTDNGKVLTVSYCELIWEELLPAWSGTDDVGKVLTIASDGTLAWQTP